MSGNFFTFPRWFSTYFGFSFDNLLSALALPRGFLSVSKNFHELVHQSFVKVYDISATSLVFSLDASRYFKSGPLLFRVFALEKSKEHKLFSPGQQANPFGEWLIPGALEGGTDPPRCVSLGTATWVRE